MENMYWRCATAGCPFARDIDDRDGYLHHCCCSRCARGKGHSGYCKKRVVAHAAFPPPFIGPGSSGSSRSHYYTRPEAGVQSHDVHYETHEVHQAVVRHPCTSNSSIMHETFFRMPERYCWMEGSLIDYIKFFAVRYAKNLSDDAVFEWEALEK